MATQASTDTDYRLTALARARARMGASYGPGQILGRTQTVGCVAVEVTQRCNLDCTLCYLSENSESVRDLPLPEVLKRLDRVRVEYGPLVNVQITGGDPTLRKHDELVSIVRHAASLDLLPSLFTNGIAASRRLLGRLAEAGLVDVAYHVDTTQRRADGGSELALCAVRRMYLERARGLGLRVLFNTTVHAGNFGELAALARFFVENAGNVAFASFQLQADTGRGMWRGRGEAIDTASVRARIEAGTGAALRWDDVQIGHAGCHSYAPALVVGDLVVPAVDDPALLHDGLVDFADVPVDRRLPAWRIAAQHAWAARRRPRWYLRAAGHVLRRSWGLRRELLAARGRVRKLSFFVHNFMHADALEQDRLDACSFMVMTHDGPLSMCAHNARRDEFILKPVRVTRQDGREIIFEPLGRRRSGRPVRGAPA